MNTFVEEDVLVEKQVVETELYDLVVFNDDVNSFEHVIRTLIEICDHETNQAEQCTWLIHYKGKCTVKHGSFNEMADMRNAICDRGLSAEVL